MAQSKEVHKEYMRRRREGSQDSSQSSQDAIVLALGDDAKREKLERICISLKKHDVLEGVRYGVSGPTFYGIAKTLGIG